MQKKHVKKKIILLSTLIWSFILNSLLISQTKAQALCDFLPCGEVDDDSTTAEGVNSRLGEIFRLVTSLIFVGLIALGVYIIIKAALKIIRSEGNSEKVQEGASSIKSVFIGLGLIFGGLIGLVVIGGILGNGLLNFDLPTPAGGDNLPIN